MQNTCLHSKVVPCGLNVFQDRHPGLQLLNISKHLSEVDIRATPALEEKLIWPQN